MLTDLHYRLLSSKYPYECPSAISHGISQAININIISNISVLVHGSRLSYTTQSGHFHHAISIIIWCHITLARQWMGQPQKYMYPQKLDFGSQRQHMLYFVHYAQAKQREILRNTHEIHWLGQLRHVSADSLAQQRNLGTRTSYSYLVSKQFKAY